MKNQKYVMLPTGPVVIPEYMNHSDVDPHRVATSAGFMRIVPDENRVVVWGDSLTLGLRHNKKDDEVKLTVMFCEMDLY